MDGKENGVELAEAQAKMNKYRARRIRVCLHTCCTHNV